MLHAAIAAGLVLGLLVGLGAAATGNVWLLTIAQASAPFGDVFMNALRMVVMPLIISIIFASIARLGDPRKLSRIGGLTIAYYWLTLLPAIAIGMATMSFGLRFARDIQMPEFEAATVPELQGIVDFLVNLVPANPFAAASNGAILPLIVFTALVAAATATLAAERRDRLVNPGTGGKGIINSFPGAAFTDGKSINTGINSITGGVDSAAVLVILRMTPAQR